MYPVRSIPTAEDLKNLRNVLPCQRETMESNIFFFSLSLSLILYFLFLVVWSSIGLPLYSSLLEASKDIDCSNFTTSNCLTCWLVMSSEQTHTWIVLMVLTKSNKLFPLSICNLDTYDGKKILYLSHHKFWTDLSNNNSSMSCPSGPQCQSSTNALI